MKKLLVSILIVICFLTLTGMVWGAEEGSKIEIRFNVGDEVLSINGKDVQVEKPVVINGVTLVPVRVITEAFGAKVDWNEKARCVTLDYSGVIIKLYIDNKKATVDGTEIELLEAPRIINGRTMVPLRFITENFGADVDYDPKTKQIVVLKESANENSIKDFSLILKKTTKEKVGDSFYNWSIDYPKTLKLGYRNFNGSINMFEAEDGSYFFMIASQKQEDQTLDSLLSSTITKIKDYTLIDQRKLSNSQGEYIKIVYKDKSSCYEERHFIKDGRVFSILLFFKEYSSYKGNRDIQKLLDSFALEFKNDGSTEDLSDVIEGGIRPYGNKNLKYSLNIIADWAEVKNEDKENEVDFADLKGNLVYISMYSYDEGLTLDQVIQQDLDHMNEEFNMDLYKLEKTENVSINGKDGKVLYFTVKLGDKVLYVVDIYLIGENYKYNFGAIITPETYNNAAEKAKILDMLYSFKFEEPDFDELGYMLDPDLVKAGVSYKTLDSDRYGWSFKLPVTWIEGEENNDGDYVEYWNDEDFMFVAMSVLEGVSYYDYTSQSIDSLRRSASVSNLTIDSIEDVTVKGVSAKKIVLTIKDGSSVYKQWRYILNKNGRVYTVIFNISNLRASENNLKTLDDIWESMNFE